MPQFYLRLLSPAEIQEDGYILGAEWAITEDDGRVRGAGVTDYRGLSDLADPSANWQQDPQNVIVIIPSEFVLGVSCVVPGKNLAQIRKALPFVVEEFVATDIEGMHLAHGPLVREQPVRCNLIDSELLTTWIECLGSLNLHPGYFISEAELLPDEDQVAYALFDGDQVLIKTSDQAATIDRDNLGIVIGSLAEKELRLLNESPDKLDNLNLPTDFLINLEPGSDPSQTTLGYLANRFHQKRTSINLLQGNYPPPKSESDTRTGWRSLAFVALAWAGLAFVAIILQGVWASVQADRLKAEAEALYRDIFPQDERIVSIKRQTMAHMGERSIEDGMGLLPLIAEIGQALNSQMQILGFNFSASRGELAVDFLIPSYDDLERIKTALEQRGLTVEVASAESQQEKVRARMRLNSNPAKGAT